MRIFMTYNYFVQLAPAIINDLQKTWLCLINTNWFQWCFWARWVKTCVDWHVDFCCPFYASRWTYSEEWRRRHGQPHELHYFLNINKQQYAVHWFTSSIQTANSRSTDIHCSRAGALLRCPAIHLLDLTSNPRVSTAYLSSTRCLRWQSVKILNRQVTNPFFPR